MSEIQNNTSSSRLQFFPVMMFAVIMGFSGITLAYKKEIGRASCRERV